MVSLAGRESRRLKSNTLTLSSQDTGGSNRVAYHQTNIKQNKKITLSSNQSIPWLILKAQIWNMTEQPGKCLIDHRKMILKDDINVPMTSVVEYIGFHGIDYSEVPGSNPCQVNVEM